jgi:cysteine desulfurase
MKVDEAALRGAVRFSLSRDNSDADVDRVLASVPGIVGKLRAISPFGSEEGAPLALDQAHG